jgi:hypothetical protein
MDSTTVHTESNTKRKARHLHKRVIKPNLVLQRRKRVSKSHHDNWSTEDSEASAADSRTSEDCYTVPNASSTETKDPNVEEDPFAILEETVIDDKIGKQCELHTYDARYDKKGELVFLRTGVKTDITLNEERSPESALVLTRYFNRAKFMYQKALLIRSPYIKAAMQKVIRSYPGVSMDSKTDTILFDEPKCLFHFRDELEEYAQNSDDPQIKDHISFCLTYMRKSLHDHISGYDNNMNRSSKAPGLEFKRLWMAFKPGDLLYMRKGDSELVYRLKDMSLMEEGEDDDDDDENQISGMKWLLHIEQLQTDGKVFGCVDHWEKIPEYEGYMALQELAIFPLKYHNEAERIREELTARGKKYVSLSGIHYRKFKGCAEFHRPYVLKRYGMENLEVCIVTVDTCRKLTCLD